MKDKLKQTPRTQAGWAVVLMIGSALCFSLMQLCSSVCAEIPAMEQVLIRNVISLGLYALVWRSGISPLGTKAQQPALLAWSVCGCLNVVFLFMAAKGGDQGSLTIIGRLSGFLVVILAAVFLHERVTGQQYIAVLLAIAGGILTVSPSGDLGGKPVILTLALLSSLFSALASICLGLLKNKVHALTVAIHFSVVSLVISLPFLFWDCVWPTGTQWLALIGIGVFGGLGQMTQMWAFERAPVGEINVYGYSGILFSMLLGWIFFGERVTWSGALGGGLVLAAGLWSYLTVGKMHPTKR